MSGCENSIDIKFWYVYLLLRKIKDCMCDGMTSGLKERLAEHDEKVVFSTKLYILGELIHFCIS